MPTWVDHFAPASVRADSERMRRARLTVLLSIVLIATGVFYAVFYGAVVGFTEGAVITGGGAAVAALVLVVLRTWPRIRFGGHMLTAVLYGALVGLLCYTGGLSSIVTPWLITPPMFAALLLGRRGAAGWTTLCVSTVAAFYAAARGGVYFPVRYPEEWVTTIRFVSFGGLVMSTAILTWVFEDIRIVAQRRAEEASAALARLAYHDALTGLTNRARFLECVDGALGRAHATGDPSRVAVLLLDLDGFKLVNDTFGHAAGDALLVEVAGRLLNATRGCDTVARLGGDEFAVLLDRVRDDASTAVVADRIVKSLGAPFTLEGRQVAISSSVGIARAAAHPEAAAASVAARAAVAGPVAPAQRRDVAALLHDADVAMYRAKALGKGRWVRFEPGMNVEPEQPGTPAVEPRCTLAPGRLGLA